MLLSVSDVLGSPAPSSPSTRVPQSPPPANASSAATALYNIHLPQTVVSSNYIGVFGLKKQVYCGYTASFTLRVEHTDQPKVDGFAGYNLPAVWNTITVGIVTMDGNHTVPVTVTSDPDAGEYTLSYTPTTPGVLEVTLDLRTKRFIPAPKSRTSVTVDPSIPLVSATPKGFVSGAMALKRKVSRIRTGSKAGNATGTPPPALDAAVAAPLAPAVAADASVPPAVPDDARRPQQSPRHRILGTRRRSSQNRRLRRQASSSGRLNSGAAADQSNLPAIPAVCKTPTPPPHSLARPTSAPRPPPSPSQGDIRKAWKDASSGKVRAPPALKLPVPPNATAPPIVTPAANALPPLAPDGAVRTTQVFQPVPRPPPTRSRASSASPSSIPPSPTQQINGSVIQQRPSSRTLPPTTVLGTVLPPMDRPPLQEGKQPDGSTYETTMQPLFGGPQYVSVVDGTTATVGPAGGSLFVPGDGSSVRLIIPRGALQDDTEVSIHKREGTTRKWRRGFSTTVLKSPITTLQPHGLRFDTPALLEIEYDSNNRYPRPCLGRLTFMHWRTEASTWQEKSGGKFVGGKAVLDVSELSCYGVGATSVTDASLMPVTVTCTSRADMVAQCRLLYDNILPPCSTVKGVGGHQLLAQFSWLKDRRREDKRLHPPAALGFTQVGGLRQSLYHLAAARTIDIAVCLTTGVEKALHLKLRNRSRNVVNVTIPRGTVFEQVEWTGRASLVSGKDVDVSLSPPKDIDAAVVGSSGPGLEASASVSTKSRVPLSLGSSVVLNLASSHSGGGSGRPDAGLSEGGSAITMKLLTYELSDSWPAPKHDEFNVTPFILERLDVLKSQQILNRWMLSKLEL